MPNSDKKPISEWNGTQISPGETCDVNLDVSESYSGFRLQIPIQVRRAWADGPTIFITAALHGDEINGTGAIRQLILDETFNLISGNLILVPVMNLLAFDRHSRYLPDRRDLNRSFPGSRSGSLASRMARTIFDEIVMRSDYGIDLHTAAVRRTNYPNVRGDLGDPEVARIAKAFGGEVIVSGRGPVSSLRREACKVGCPTIIMEGGEVWKVEPTIVESAVRGIKNVLIELGMVEGKSDVPPTQLAIHQTKWIRAERGGFLQFHVKPGELVREGQIVATNTNLLGKDVSSLHAPFDGVIIGMSTLPAVSPGEPVCHVGKLPDGVNPSSIHDSRKEEEGLEGRIVENLASNILVVEPPGKE